MSDADVARLANMLGVLAVALADGLEGASARTAGQGGGAAAALVQIATRPGLSIDELRRRIALSHSAVVRLVDRLVERGLVRRARSATDARAATLILTADGVRLADEVLAARRELLGDVVGRLSTEGRRELEASVEWLLRGLPASAAECCVMCRLCRLEDCPLDRCPVELRYNELSRAAPDGESPYADSG
jgi:MarR family transcriptional regulator, negative regulator of the multidrug operon emrRAB